MTDEHKSLLAAGRADARAVKAYLEAIDKGSARRGRQRTVASITKRLQAIEASLSEVSALVRLQLIQERSNLEAELEEKTAGPQADLERLRAEFIAVAKSYGVRKSIDYASWRAVGVDAATLRQAGITR